MIFGLKGKRWLAVLLGGLFGVAVVTSSALAWWPGAAIAMTGLLVVVLLLVAHAHQLIADSRKALTTLQRREAKNRKKLATLGADVDLAARAAIDQHAVLLRTSVINHLDVMDASIREIGRDLIAATGRLEQRATEVLAGRYPTDDTELEETLREIGGRLSSLEAVTAKNASMAARDLERLRHEPVTEIDAMLQLHRRFPMSGSVPLMWGWAMSPRALLQVVDLASRDDCHRVVECGSGTSTVYLGQALKTRPGTSLIALEHLPEIADAVSEQVERHGLQDIVDVRLAPLRPVEIAGDVYPWYDLDALHGVSRIDLLVVDGPPGTTSPLARFPAVPLLTPRLADGCYVVLDDARRQEERDIARRWQEGGGVIPVKSRTRDQAVMRRATTLLPDTQGSAPREAGRTE